MKGDFKRMNIIPQDGPQKQCTKCKEWLPLTSYHADKWKKDGWKTRCKECEKKQHQDYHAKPEVQEHYREHRKAYYEQPEVKERRTEYTREYHHRPGMPEYERERQRAYHNRPEVKSHRKDVRKAYDNRPEIQERDQTYGDWYRHLPDIQEREKARRKVYRSDPAQIERELTFRKDYNSRPHVQERYRVATRLRTVRKREIQGTYTKEQIQEQLKRQHYKCYYAACGFSKFKKSKGRYTYHIEHTYPISRAVGTDIPANDMSYLVLACPSCNLKKGNKLPHEFFEGGRLF